MRESAPFPRTNRQASSLVPRCGVLPARYSAGVEPIPSYYLNTIRDVLKNAVELDERVHLRLASRKSVKNETHKYVIFILVGSCGTSGQRKCTIKNSVGTTRPIMKGRESSSLHSKLSEIVPLKNNVIERGLY